jgi:hypothetical protein
MKKTLITLALASAVVSTGLAQGTITWGNANSSKISVNAVAGGALTGFTPAFAGTTATTFYYALFYSTATTVGGLGTAIMPLNNANGTYAFEDSNWTFLSPGAIGGYTVGPAYATNSQTAGRYTVENNDPAHSGATITANTTPEHWVVLGWSASLGTDLSSLATAFNNGSPSANGWIGESVVSALLTPGDPTTTPTGLPQGVFPGAFSLGMVYYVPEPSTIALAGLGGLSLLLFRRRK